jgi:hypothetical protein
LVRRREPAMMGKVRLRPPKKKPSELFFSSFLVIHQVRAPAKIVKRRKETTVIVIVRSVLRKLEVLKYDDKETRVLFQGSDDHSLNKDILCRNESLLGDGASLCRDRFKVGQAR